MTVYRRTGTVITHDFTPPAFSPGSCYYCVREGIFEEIEQVTILKYPAELTLAGGSIVNLHSRSVLRKSIYPPFVESVSLTPREWLLYELLAAKPNECIRWLELVAALVPETEWITTDNDKKNRVRQVVWRLRGKIGRDAVAEIPRLGYRLVCTGWREEGEA